MDERRDDNHVELVSEMMARYLDEWIFFEVVEDDEYERPYKRRLIAHSPDRDEIHRECLEPPYRANHLRKVVAAFRAPSAGAGVRSERY